MNYGFVKVAAAVPHVKVADCKFNVEKIESLIAVAEGKGVQIILFPEMSITGYTCGDLFSQQLLLEEAEMGLMQILNNTRQLDIISIVGMPVIVNSTVINAAVTIQKGKILGVTAKTYLPNYKEFYEQRWFTSALQLRTETVRLCGQVVPIGANLLFETSDTTFGIEICEDLWATIHPAPPSHCKGRRSYSICPPTMKESENIVISVHLSASNPHVVSPDMYSHPAASENLLQMWFSQATD